MPRDEQFDAIKPLLDDGLIRHAGLSEVSVDDIEAAPKVFPVATVQNRYNLVDRGSEDVLDYCEANGIGFIPWFPLAAGDLAKPGSLLDAIAKRHGAAPSQIALAWLLEAQPGDAADPGHLEGRASGGERRGGEYRAVRRGFRRARPGRATANRRIIGRHSPASARDPAEDQRPCRRTEPARSFLSGRLGQGRR